jgi:hypothetical protein
LISPIARISNRSCVKKRAPGAPYAYSVCGFSDGSGLRSRIATKPETFDSLCVERDEDREQLKYLRHCSKCMLKILPTASDGFGGCVAAVGRPGRVMVAKRHVRTAQVVVGIDVSDQTTNLKFWFWMSQLLPSPVFPLPFAPASSLLGTRTKVSEKARIGPSLRSINRT